MGGVQPPALYLPTPLLFSRRLDTPQATCYGGRWLRQFGKNPTPPDGSRVSISTASLPSERLSGCSGGLTLPSRLPPSILGPLPFSPSFASCGAAPWWQLRSASPAPLHSRPQASASPWQA